MADGTGVCRQHGPGAADARPCPDDRRLRRLQARRDRWSRRGRGGGFLPSFVIMLSILPALDRVRRLAWIKAMMRGMAAAVIGVLAVSLARLSPAAVPDPVALLILLGTVAATLFFQTGASKLMIGGAEIGVLRSRLPLTVFTRPF